MKKIVTAAMTLLFIFISCVQEQAVIKIESIEFMEKEKTMFVGESCYAEITYLPSDATDIEIEYSSYPEDALEISGNTETGCVIKALKKGNPVLSATSNGRTAYLQINVEEEVYTADPYIMLPFVTLELESGRRKTVVANLVGGNIEDNQGFKWTSSDEKVCQVNYTNNQAIFTGGKKGTAVITVENSKSQYAAQMTVYVPDVRKELFYLTTDDNVITLLPGNTISFSIRSIGGNEEDLSKIEYEIEEGKEYFEINGNNGTCSVTGKGEGRGKIKVSHPKAKANLEIEIIINEAVDGSYIYTENPFIILDGKSSREIKVEMKGSKKEGKYSYRLSEQGIIEVSNEGNCFIVKPIKDGNCKIEIMNTECSHVLEIAVAVENSELKSNVNYIYTERNFIKTEKGSEDILINMELAGGNESDRNSFEWEVSDSSVINLVTEDGTVNYLRNTGIIEKEDTYKATALIRPVGIGNARVHVKHPKSIMEQDIEVIVYPEGTFRSIPLTVKGENLIKVIKGQTIEYSIKKVNGEEKGEYKWKSSDNEIVRVSGNGKKCMITGVGRGVTKVTVDNEYLDYPFSFTVISGEEDEIEELNAIYIKEQIIEINEGEYEYIKLLKNGNINFKEIQINISDNEKCSVYRIEDTLCIEGKKEGNTEIIINAEGCMNQIVIPVKIYGKKISYDKPYELKGPEFIGVVKGKTIETECSLKNAGENELKKIIWKGCNDEIFSVEGNENKGVIKGIDTGKGEIIIKHEKSINDKKIIVYVEETEKELEEKVLLYSDKTDFLVNKGENIILRVISNKDDIYGNIIWECENAEKVEMDANGNTCLVKCISEGNVTVRARYNDEKMNFFISIAEDNISGTGDFYVPPVIETAAGKSIKVEADTSNLERYYAGRIIWESSDEEVSLKSNGESCILNSEKAGCYKVEVSIPELKKVKLINYIVYEKEEDSGYVIGIEDSYYRMKKNGEIKVQLKNGLKELDSKLIESLRWEYTSNNVIEIYPSGMSAIIKGLNQGISTVRIYSENEKIMNEIKINIEVNENELENTGITFAIDRINKALKNEINEIEIKAFREGKEITDYENFKFYMEGNEIECNFVNGLLRFRGKKAGNTVVKVNYAELYEYEFLICIYENNTDKDNKLEIFASKNNLLLEKESEEEIELYISDYEKADLIGYSAENGVEVTKTGKGIYRIKGKEKGNYEVKFNCDNKEITVYVSVTDEILIEEEEINTENIIIMNVGEEYMSQAYCRNSLNWYTTSYGIELHAVGNKCNIIAIEKGLHEIEVYNKYSNVRKIIVYVKDVNEDDPLLINMDKRDIKIGINEKIKITPYIKGKEFKIEKTEFEEMSGNGSSRIEYNEKEKAFYLEGLKEGISEFRVSNGDSNKIKIIITVSREYEGKGKVSTFIPDFYMYAPYGNSIQLEKEEEYTVTVFTAGSTEKFEGKESYRWISSDYSIIKIESEKNQCRIKALKEGKCTITVSNEYCSNAVSYEVIIGKKYINEGNESHFIYSQKNIYYADEKDGSITIPVSLHNIDKEKLELIDITFDKEGIIEPSKIKYEEQLLINARIIKRGRCKMELSLPECDFKTYIDIIIKENEENKAVYITTEQNYVSLKPGELVQVEVELKNADYEDTEDFKWSITEGDSCITVIGKGRKVQIYGNSNGKCKVKVENKKSIIPLEININVSDEEISAKYITTDSNVIECYAGDGMGTLDVTLIGEAGKDSYFKYVSSDESILQVIGNGNTCYYKGIREGEAQITVRNESDAMIPEMKITVIVLKHTGEEVYLTCENPVIYMNPGENGKSVSVKINNMDAYENEGFEWTIYSEEFKYVSEGDVVSIVSAGERAVIKPLNEGIAKIRCTYKPKNTYVNILVTVSSEKVFEFSEKNIEIIENESVFVNVNIPYFGNRNRISFSSSNNEICEVFGTESVACISGKKCGNAVIYAKNDYDNSECQVSVKVLNEEEVINKIGVSDESVMLTVSDKKKNLKAYITGNDIFGYDEDNLEWEIKKKSTESIDIYPKKGKEVILEVKKIKKSDDEYYGEVKPGYAIIGVKHEKCPVEKTIYVTIDNPSNYFTLNEYSLNMEMNEMNEIECNITGAASSDYNDVSWSVYYDVNDEGIKTENIKLLNTKGKKCSVMAVKEGTCYVHAYYNGIDKTCAVKVEASQFFNLKVKNISMFPDSTFELEYDIKPKTVIPTFTVKNSDSENQLINIEVIEAEKKIRVISGSKEGNASIVGYAAGIGYKECYVDVKYSPYLRNLIKTNDYNQSIVMYDEGTDEFKNNGKNSAEFYFTSYPSDYDIKVENLSSGYYKKDIDFTYNIEKDKISGDCKFTVTALKEMGSPLEFKLSQLNDGKEVKGGETLKYSVKQAMYEDFGFDIEYKKGIGEKGNEQCKNAESYRVKSITEKNGELTVSDSCTLSFGDGESNYIVLIPKHKGQKLELLLDESKPSGKEEDQYEVIEFYGGNMVWGENFRKEYSLKLMDEEITESGNLVMQYGTGEKDFGFEYKYRNDEDKFYKYDTEEARKVGKYWYNQEFLNRKITGITFNIESEKEKEDYTLDFSTQSRPEDIYTKTIDKRYTITVPYEKINQEDDCYATVKFKNRDDILTSDSKIYKDKGFLGCYPDSDSMMYKSWGVDTSEEGCVGFEYYSLSFNDEVDKKIFKTEIKYETKVENCSYVPAGRSTPRPYGSYTRKKYTYFGGELIKTENLPEVQNYDCNQENYEDFKKYYEETETEYIEIKGRSSFCITTDGYCITPGLQRGNWGENYVPRTEVVKNPLFKTVLCGGPNGNGNTELYYNVSSDELGWESFKFKDWLGLTGWGYFPRNEQRKMTVTVNTEKDYTAWEEKKNYTYRDIKSEKSKVMHNNMIFKWKQYDETKSIYGDKMYVENGYGYFLANVSDSPAASSNYNGKKYYITLKIQRINGDVKILKIPYAVNVYDGKNIEDKKENFGQKYKYYQE